jgi:hypothetical protein
VKPANFSTAGIRAILAAAVAGAILWGLGFWAVGAFGAGPIRAHGGRTPCPNLQACRAAVKWQAKDRRWRRWRLCGSGRRGAGVGAASAAFGVPVRDMRSVAQCESGMGAQVTAEAGSGASGLFQFLDSTWRHTPFATFDVFDPLPNALAAAQIVAHDGGWGQWTCQP